MKVFQPPTLLRLILIGYFVILLPLIAAMLHGAQSLSFMSSRNSEQIERVITLVRGSESVSQGLIDWERTLRQYEILGDESLLQLFKNKKAVLIAIVSGLREQSRYSDDLLLVTGDMSRAIESVSIQGLDPGNNQSIQMFMKQNLVQIELLSELHRRLKALISSDFDRFILEAEQGAQDTQSLLLYTGVALLPGTLILIALFTTLIAGPIKQIEDAIRSLSAGDYSGKIAVQGPRDLQALGVQLRSLGHNLKSADEGKKRFLRHMSHELKTPLASIKEGTSLLRDEIPGPLTDSQSEVVDIMHDSVENLQMLMNNLLDFNLLSQGRDHRKKDCRIYDLVGDIVRYHRLTIERKQVNLVSEGSHSLVASVDISMLRTALDNLVSNAIHFTPPNGSITVYWSCDEKKKRLFVGVKDSGPGIPKHEKAQIFEPFFQGSARRDGPIKGTGLGLSVVSECARMMDAEISLDSKLGEGAHFEMSIPCRVTKEA